MERRIRLFLQSTLVLVALGTSVEVSAQPEVITEIPVNSTDFVTVGDLVFFRSGDELWRTDGTEAGTILLGSGFVQPGFFTGFNGAAYFTNANNSELWKSDGTSSGTLRLHASGNNELRMLGEASGNLFFQAYDAATGLELYRTDGTAGGTVMVKDIDPGAASGFAGHAAVTGNLLFFAADDGTNGRELWKSDGSSGGTVMVEDINPGPADGFGNQVSVLADNNLFYFGGTPPDSGIEPWVSDGTAGGTYLLHDYVSDWEAPLKLDYGIAHDGTVFFLASLMDGMGSTELWRTDGTPGSTQLIENVGYDPDNFHSFRVYNNKVYFFNDSDPTDYLWVTDGTPEGTEAIFDDTAGEGYFHYFDVVNNHLLFTGDAQSYPTPFFRSDGTEAGTQAFREFNAYSFAGGVTGRIGVTTVGDFAFFADHDGPVESGEVPSNPADYFHLFQTDGFTTESMRTKFGVATVGADNITDFNGKAIFTTYDDQDGGAGEPKRLWIYDPANASGPVASFTLVDADTDNDLQTIQEGEVITKSDESNINIRFNPAESPGSVVFNLNGNNVRTETAPPYALAGDVNGDYAPWAGAVPGSYTLTATPYSESGGRGEAGTPYTVSFTIEADDGTPSGPCAASGTILREVWQGVAGSRVSDIPVQTAPTSSSQLSSFEGPTNSGTNYGARISGYICPPQTGNYTFWIASNDHSELWLSTDDNPANKVRIAYVEGATTPQQWAKFSSQRSASIPLTSGTRYYIEALHKQGAGSDNVAVGWQLPDGTMERPIPGNRLSPAGGSENNAPLVTITQPENGWSSASPTNVVIYADASDSDGTVTKVEFFAGDTKIGEDYTPHPDMGYQYIWKYVPPGTHTITARATDNSGGIGTSEPVTFTVTGEACAATGYISRDYWANVSGARVSDIPLDSPPTSSSEIDIFEGPSDVGSNYASRIRGYICPPITGNYTFWIASNDHSELWLNAAGADPSGKQRIAFIEGATGPQQWTKFASQRSAPMMLEQGKRYYIEALHKQGVGSDHLAVGWMWPNNITERPIPGRYLSPFEMGDPAARMSSSGMDATDEKAVYAKINIYPNPMESGDAELRVAGFEGVSESIETSVEIINLTGEVVYQEQIRCGGNCSDYLMNLNQELVPGVYMVNMRTNGARFSKRLLVK